MRPPSHGADHAPDRGLPSEPVKHRGVLGALIGAKLSPGTVCKVEDQVGNALAEAHAEALGRVRQAKVKNLEPTTVAFAPSARPEVRDLCEALHVLSKVHLGRGIGCGTEPSRANRCRCNDEQASSPRTSSLAGAELSPIQSEAEVAVADEELSVPVQ